MFAVRGFAQKKGVNYEETFASVVKFKSIRMILSIAAYKKHKVYQMDVKTAFLNGRLSEEIHGTT